MAIAVALAELVLRCHCAQWRQMPGGYYRCAVIVERCELVSGPHIMQLDVVVCSRGCDL